MRIAASGAQAERSKVSRKAATRRERLWWLGIRFARFFVRVGGQLRGPRPPYRILRMDSRVTPAALLGEGDDDGDIAEAIVGAIPWPLRSRSSLVAATRDHADRLRRRTDDLLADPGWASKFGRL